MKNISNNLIYLLLFLIFLSACQSVKEGLTGTKRSNSDEFLVEKKNPLVLPPEFNKLPVPNEIVSNDELTENDNDQGTDLLKILGAGTASIENDPETITENSSLEKSIIEKIKKKLMFTKNINLKSFRLKRNSKKIRVDLKLFLKENNTVLKSLGLNYINKYNKKLIKKFNKYSNLRIIGMGGSILGTETIYDFLKHKIKKNFFFINNLKLKNNTFNKKKSYTNLIVSKSGNTLETITNTNIIIKNTDKNIFITENKKSYLLELAKKLKAEIIYHNNFIGGRYSVLSEVGMLPAELMGLNTNKFKQINYLIKNKKFINLLVNNVSSTLYFLKQKKFNSIILNYDEKSNNLFRWYQQLVAESLGKNKNGILPIISSMPKDNHSLMQLYLDGPTK